MICPKCKSKTKVTDSRVVDEMVFRKRVCIECSFRFTTEEMTIEDNDIRKEYEALIYSKRKNT